MGKNFLVYYNLKNGDFRVIKSDNPDIVETIEILPPTKKYKRFHCFANYEASDAGIKQYYNDFLGWCDELKNNDIWKIKYNQMQIH